MAYDQEVRGECELLYCVHGKDIPQIAEKTGVSESTLRRWRAKQSWDEKVVARVISGPMIAQQLKQQVYKIVQQANNDGRLIDSKEADRISKMRKMINDLDGDAVFVSHAMEAMDQFNSWLDEEAPELRQKIAPLMMEFTRELVKGQSHRL